MSNLSVEMILKLIDQATGPLKSVISEFDKLKNSAHAANGTMAAPAGGDGWAERKKRIEETAGAVDALEKKMANISLAMDGYKNIANIGAAIGAPIDKIEERATAFEKAQEALARAGGILSQQKELSRSALALAKETSTKWEEITAGRRAFIGLGGGERFAQLRGEEGNLLKLAFASNTKAEEMYKMAFSYMDVAGLSAKQAVAALMVNYEQGKRGAYELKDLVNGMPALISQGKGFGLTGEQIASDLPAFLQILRKASGSPGEANTRLRNVMKQFTDPKIQEKIESELGIDVPKEMKAAKAAGENPLFRVLNQIADKLQAVPADQRGKVGKSEDEGVSGGGELGSVFRNYYVRAGVEAFAQLRDQLKEMTPTADEASKTAISDFASRAGTAAEAANRLAIALDAAAVKAGDTQLEDKKKMNDRKAGAVNWMTGVAEKYPGLTSGAIDAWDYTGKALQGVGNAAYAAGGAYFGWQGLKVLGTKFPWMATVGNNVAGVATGVVKAPLDMARGFAQGVNAATVEAAAKAGGEGAARAVAASRGAAVGGALRAAGTAAGPLPLLGAIDATDDASSSYRRMKSDYAARHGHEVESWAGAKEFYGTLFNGIKSMFGERPGSAAGAQAGAAMAAAPAQPTVDAAAAESAKQRILAMGADMKAALDINGAVSMDTAGLDGAIAKAQQLVTLLTTAGSLAARASLGIGRGLKPSSGALHDGPETK